MAPDLRFRRLSDEPNSLIELKKQLEARTRELAEAREQQAATSEVLQIISGSSGQERLPTLLRCSGHQETSGSNAAVSALKSGELSRFYLEVAMISCDQKRGG